MSHTDMMNPAQTALGRPANPLLSTYSSKRNKVFSLQPKARWIHQPCQTRTMISRVHAQTITQAGRHIHAYIKDQNMLTGT